MRELGRDRGTLLWEAHDDEEMTVVHVRILQEHLRSEPLVGMRFRREVSLAGRLDHPGLVAPRELVDDESGLALVYEVGGTRTLTERLREGTMEPAEAAVLLEPVLEGLAVAHRRGVIHRNISPDHIWLDDGGEARLGGFGGAKVLDMVGLTTQSMAFGLSHYRAPEQWFAQAGQEGDADPRTDVWALGAILFEMILGRPPVAAIGPQAMTEGFEALDLDEVLGDLAPTAVGQAIMAALVVDRRDRLASVGELADVLLGRIEAVERTHYRHRLGPPCWCCDHPRVETLDFCLRCGQGPIVQDPDEGTVDVIVPKFRRGREYGDMRRFSGSRNIADLFFRTFHPQLDADEKALLRERLQRAGASFDEKSDHRMAHSPFRIASDLTWPDAYRLMAFLKSGTPDELAGSAGKVLVSPKETIEGDHFPVLFRHVSEQGWLDKLGWSLKGLSWSSPVLFSILAVGSVAGGVIGVLLILVLVMVALFEGPFDPEWLVGMVVITAIIGPIWAALFWKASRNRRPAVSFERPRRDVLSESTRDRWTALMVDLVNERDRLLVEEVMDVVTRVPDQAEDWLAEVEEDVMLLTRSPRDSEWQRLQVLWEGLQAQARQEGLTEAGERAALAREMKRHEKSVEESELARARIFAFVEGLRPRQRAVVRDESLAGSLEELRLLHQSLVDLEGSPTLETIGPARQELSLGLTLPERFDVIRRIASGGMADVILAHDHYREEHVALKIPLPEHRGLPQIGALMRKEFEAARKVHHPGLVAIHEHLEIDGVDVLVMEYIEGVDLKTMIRWRETLPPAEVRAIGEQILDTLAVAHQCGVVHGDIKPANILIGDDDRVVLVDFGLARMEYLARDEELESRLGTPGYAAPEILEGGLVDERADLYGLGLTLFEALTGTPPFGADHSAPVEGDDFQQVEAGLAFRDVLRRAAAADPATRFRSAQEMKAALNPEAEVTTIDDLVSTATVEACHACGAARHRYLHRCGVCGARRYAVGRRFFGGKQVVVKGNELGSEEILDLRRVIDEFQGIYARLHFDETLAELPALLTPSMDPLDARTMAATLERKGFDVAIMGAFTATVYRGIHSWRRLLSSFLPLLALPPTIIAAVLLLDYLRVYIEPIHVFTVIIIFGVTLVSLLAAELLPGLRSATEVEKGRRGAVETASPTPFEDRAIDVLLKARTERTRALVDGLVTAFAEVRQSWLESPEHRDMVDALDELAVRAFDSVEALMKAEEVVAGVSALERTAHQEEAQRRVVQIGSGLVRLARELRELKLVESLDSRRALEEFGTVLDFDILDFDVVGKNTVEEGVAHEMKREVEEQVV